MQNRWGKTQRTDSEWNGDFATNFHRAPSVSDKIPAAHKEVYHIRFANPVCCDKSVEGRELLNKEEQLAEQPRDGVVPFNEDDIEFMRRKENDIRTLELNKWIAKRYDGTSDSHARNKIFRGRHG